VVLAALQGGVNLIDTAYWYGHGRSEERLAVALSGVPRQAYYLQSKCCRYESDVRRMFDFSAERTIRAVDDALARLGVPYLDCMQVHDPEYAPSLDVVLNETLPALQKCKDAGKIRAIGMTGYPLELHREVLRRSKVKVDSFLCYCHYTLNDSSLVDSGLLDELRASGAGVVAASPVSMGLLTAQGPPAWHPASAAVKLACRRAAEYCAQAGYDYSRLAVDFALREERIPTTLVSTTSLDILRRNLDTAYALREPLSSQDRRSQLELREQFFKPLARPSWEGVEVALYHDLIKRVDAGERVGTLSTLEVSQGS
jgi:aryl-alcohol dehydrogenase-like predicted oxidoreductase